MKNVALASRSRNILSNRSVGAPGPSSKVNATHGPPQAAECPTGGAGAGCGAGGVSFGRSGTSNSFFASGCCKCFVSWLTCRETVISPYDAGSNSPRPNGKLMVALSAAMNCCRESSLISEIVEVAGCCFSARIFSTYFLA